LPARVTLLAAARYANSVKPFHSTPPRASFSLSACLAYLTARVAASRQPVLCDHRPILAGSVSSPTSQTAAFGMSGSRRERQLTGAAANSHSRPAADGPERLLPGPRRHGTCAGSEKPLPAHQHCRAWSLREPAHSSQSAVAPDVFTALRHASVEAFTKSPNCWAVPPASCRPWAKRKSLVVGSASTRLISALS